MRLALYRDKYLCVVCADSDLLLPRVLHQKVMDLCGFEVKSAYYEDSRVKQLNSMTIKVESI
jgi:hypothetical protein